MVSFLCGSGFFSWFQRNPKPSQPESQKETVSTRSIPLEPVVNQPSATVIQTNVSSHSGELDRFIVLNKELGIGSTCSVQGVIDKNSGEKLAMKQILRTSSNSFALSRERDIHVLVSKEKHENIIQCREVLEDSNQMTLILEYMKGGDLLDAIPSGKGLEPKVVLSYARQLILALKYLHSLGVSHRDIKPDNCLLSADKKTLKLCDFGHAVLGNSTLLLTEESGTIPYMSPETITRKVKDRFAADIWSFGCVIFAMSTGRFPWCLAASSNTEYALYTQGKHSVVEKERWDSFPAPITHILHECLATDPEKRPTADMALTLVEAALVELYEEDIIEAEDIVVDAKVELKDESITADVSTHVLKASDEEFGSVVPYDVQSLNMNLCA